MKVQQQPPPAAPQTAGFPKGLFDDALLNNQMSEKADKIMFLSRLKRAIELVLNQAIDCDPHQVNKKGCGGDDPSSVAAHLSEQEQRADVQIQASQ